MKSLLANFRNSIYSIKWDLTRLNTRIRTRVMLSRYLRRGGQLTRLHFGCGPKIVEGFLNVDIRDSEIDIDLASAKLPFLNNQFTIAVSQQFIEHLHITSELIPLLKEINRILITRGELWLSCPDIEKICAGYMFDKGSSLVEGREQRFSSWDWNPNRYPSAQIINHFFHQDGEHKNLFDFELLQHILLKAGFKNIERKDENSFLEVFSGFPKRNDDDHSLYVKAVK